jgi:hypothetical protein
MGWSEEGNNSSHFTAPPLLRSAHRFTRSSGHRDLKERSLYLLMALPDLIALVVEAEIGMVGGSATRYRRQKPIRTGLFSILRYSATCFHKKGEGSA